MRSHSWTVTLALTLVASTSCGTSSWRNDLAEASRRGTYLLDCPDTDVITGWMGGRFFESTGCGKWVAVECVKRECRPAAPPRTTEGNGPHRAMVDRSRRVREALLARTDDFLTCTGGRPFMVTFRINDQGLVSEVNAPRNYHDCIHDQLDRTRLPTGRGRLQVRHKFTRSISSGGESAGAGPGTASRVRGGRGWSVAAQPEAKSVQSTSEQR